MFERKLAEGEIDEEMIIEKKYFDPSYIEVDRILYTAEMF